MPPFKLRGDAEVFRRFGKFLPFLRPGGISRQNGRIGKLNGFALLTRDAALGEDVA